MNEADSRIDGTSPIVKLTPKQERAFWNKVQVEGDDQCWNWSAGKRHGYGSVKLNGRKFMSNRIAFFLSSGEIPTGMRVLHTCDNPSCCNPAHLFLGTQKDNAVDRTHKGRTVPRGNVLSEERKREVRMSNYSPKYWAFVLDVSETYIRKILKS